MALRPLQRKQNIRASLEKHLQDTLHDVDGVEIRYPMVPFDPAGKDSWVELWYFGKDTVRTFSRVEDDTPGADTEILLHVYCFGRETDGSSAYIVEQVRDKVLGRLNDNVKIEVKDYATYGESATTVEGYIRVRYEGEHLLPPSTALGGQVAIRAGESLTVLIMEFVLRYIEPFGVVG